MGWAPTLFLIFLRIFFSDFSSALLNGNRWGTGYPSEISVRFSSSVKWRIPVAPFCNDLGLFITSGSFFRINLEYLPAG